MTALTSSTGLLSAQPEAREIARAFEWRDALLKCAIVFGSAAIVFLAAKFHARSDAFTLLWHTRLGRPLIIAGGAYAGLTAIWSAWRLVLALLYRPIPNVSTHELPRITVVVPAFNEQTLIARTLRHLANADYPARLLEIIVVDDGSTDDTWRHIQHAVSTFPTRITAVRLDANRGKRLALYEGFRRAGGDIFVTVDSDSLIERDALRALVSPLVRDTTVGAVAGNVLVLNKQDGLIPRMLDVRYVMTFDYKRAAQSMMSGGGVLCVAGALAAYRRVAVIPILDQWLHQTWLGRAARAGEDHAMTNFVLRRGFKVRFQRTARVYTQSPTTYAGLAKMFLRWGRNNVRETAHLGSFIFRARVAIPGIPSTTPVATALSAPTPVAPVFNRCLCDRFPTGRKASSGEMLLSLNSTGSRRCKLAMRFNYLVGATGLIVPYVFLGAAMVLSCLWPAAFGLKMLAACIAGGAFPLLFYAARKRDSEALIAIPYSFYATLLLSWVWPYALLTSHKSVWMTRAGLCGKKSIAANAQVCPQMPAKCSPKFSVLSLAARGA